MALLSPIVGGSLLSSPQVGAEERPLAISMAEVETDNRLTLKTSLGNMTLMSSNAESDSPNSLEVSFDYADGATSYLLNYAQDIRFTIENGNFIGGSQGTLTSESSYHLITLTPLPSVTIQYQVMDATGDGVINLDDLTALQGLVGTESQPKK